MEVMAGRVGTWAARAAFVCSVFYVVAQLAEWAGWLGSAGGPHASSTPLGILILLTPSLLLGPAFLMTMVAVHERTAADLRVWSLGALAFAIAYFVMIEINYYVQLAWVMPRLAAGRIAGMEPFLFTPFDSFLYAVDILGYSMMCVSMPLAGLTFTGRLRYLCFANGCLVPSLALQMYWHDLIWIAASWAVLFPWAMWELGREMQRGAAGVIGGCDPQSA